MPAGEAESADALARSPSVGPSRLAPSLPFSPPLAHTPHTTHTHTHTRSTFKSAKATKKGKNKYVAVLGVLLVGACGALAGCGGWGRVRAGAL